MTLFPSAAPSSPASTFAAASSSHDLCAASFEGAVDRASTKSDAEPTNRGSYGDMMPCQYEFYKVRDQTEMISKEMNVIGDKMDEALDLLDGEALPQPISTANLDWLIEEQTQALADLKKCREEMDPDNWQGDVIDGMIGSAERQLGNAKGVKRSLAAYNVGLVGAGVTIGAAAGLLAALGAALKDAVTPGFAY